MKKKTVLFASCLLGTLAFSSCEKNLYDESKQPEKGLSRNLVGIIFYTREVLLTSHYEKRLFDHASQPRVAGADIRLLSYLWSRTNLSRDSYQSG